MAIMVSLALHITSISIMAAFGFRLSQFLGPFAEASAVPISQTVHRATSIAVPTATYILFTAFLGFCSGCIVAIGVVKGPLRFLAMHKWIYDIIDSDRKRGIITAYVMTKVIEDSKVLMYRGRLHEIFLGVDGRICYIILKNCARFYMLFGESPTTTRQLELFGNKQAERRTWDYLQIEGEDISNVLFEPSQETIRTSTEGEQALAAELSKRQAELRARIQHMRQRLDEHMAGPPPQASQ